jgi:hypothetical protein
VAVKWGYDNRMAVTVTMTMTVTVTIIVSLTVSVSVSVSENRVDGHSRRNMKRQLEHGLLALSTDAAKSLLCRVFRQALWRQYLIARSIVEPASAIVPRGSATLWHLIPRSHRRQ